jgi:hypothetical protein
MFCHWAALVSRVLLDQLIELVERSRLRELVYTSSGTRIRLVKREDALGLGVAVQHPGPTPPPMPVGSNDDPR